MSASSFPTCRQQRGLTKAEDAAPTTSGKRVCKSIRAKSYRPMAQTPTLSPHPKADGCCAPEKPRLKIQIHQRTHPGDTGLCPHCPSWPCNPCHLFFPRPTMDQRRMQWVELRYASFGVLPSLSQYTLDVTQVIPINYFGIERDGCFSNYYQKICLTAFMIG